MRLNLSKLTEDLSYTTPTKFFGNQNLGSRSEKGRGSMTDWQGYFPLLELTRETYKRRELTCHKINFVPEEFVCSRGVGSGRPLRQGVIIDDNYHKFLSRRSCKQSPRNSEDEIASEARQSIG